MKTDLPLTLQQFKEGNVRALSRLISLVEDGAEEALPLLSEIYSLQKNTQVIGITGPPGAGKSTLINGLVRHFRSCQEKVAVLAVDPISPFSGGAVLGDRIRLAEHFNDPAVYVRSLSTRGKLGGLSVATYEAVHLLSAFGFDRVLIETVGVGQSEVDIHQLSDTTLVVLTPEWGDGIQAIKAGVLEIANIFVVNKADREGADRVVAELRNLVSLAGKDDTPILTTSALDTNTLTPLVGYLEAKPRKHTDKKRDAKLVVHLVENRFHRAALAWESRTNATRNPNPYQAIVDLEQSLGKPGWFPEK